MDTTVKVRSTVISCPLRSVISHCSWWTLWWRWDLQLSAAHEEVSSASAADRHCGEGQIYSYQLPFDRGVSSAATVDGHCGEGETSSYRLPLEECQQPLQQMDTAGKVRPTVISCPWRSVISHCSRWTLQWRWDLLQLLAAPGGVSSATAADGYCGEGEINSHQLPLEECHQPLLLMDTAVKMRSTVISCPYRNVISHCS